MPDVKAFLRREGGVDQYPHVKLRWLLHHRPELHAKNRYGRNVTVDLSPMKDADLHALFDLHFARADVAPPPVRVRLWRRLFGWAYGISTFEATLLHFCGFVLFLILMYAMCYRYTAICDSIQDI